MVFTLHQSQYERLSLYLHRRSHQMQSWACERWQNRCVVSKRVTIGMLGSPHRAIPEACYSFFFSPTPVGGRIHRLLCRVHCQPFNRRLGQQGVVSTPYSGSHNISCVRKILLRVRNHNTKCSRCSSRNHGEAAFPIGSRLGYHMEYSRGVGRP